MIRKGCRAYCVDFGPDVVIFAHGYAEEYDGALRARAPVVWILDSEAAERLLRELWR